MIDTQIHLIPLQNFPLVKPGDDIASLILDTIRNNELVLSEGDIMVVTHSIISLAENKIYHLDKVRVSDRAKSIAEKTGHSPEQVEIALSEARGIIRDNPVLITKTKHGVITDYSGIDESNAPLGTLIGLPDDPDESAGRIRELLSKKMGFNIPVIITDTQGRPWRKGAINIAIGIAGMKPFIHNAGKEDLYGHDLRGSLICLADQIASSVELVMGQANEGIPVVIVRGIQFEKGEGSASEIIRSESENLFS